MSSVFSSRATVGSSTPPRTPTEVKSRRDLRESDSKPDRSRRLETRPPVSMRLPDEDVPPTSFFTALYSPYADPLPPPPPRIPRPYRSTCRATVDWTVRPAPDMTSSDEEDDEMDAPEIPEDLLDQPAYEPVPRWAWTTKQPLRDAVLLRHLDGDATCSTTLMRAKIDGTELTYMCKSWSRVERPSWSGFYSELKLYSSPNYLRDLQGFIVPNIINVYDGPFSISFLMELPHTSFWMEASADMPNVLKKAVVEAYIILHNQGILHGEAELRNMLIGGDGRVTLVNFHAARAREPIPELGLERADKHELALELRQVMYKLDYEGARARENARMQRFAALNKLNKRRRADGHREEKPMLEELAERPPPPEVWQTQWVNVPDAPPRRHVVPGQAPDELQRCIDSFRVVIQRMEEFDAKEMTSPLIRWGRSSAASGASEDLSSLRNSRKRKAASEDSELPYKRVRGDEDVDEPPLPPSTYDRTSTTYDTGTSEALLPASSAQTTAPKEVRVRDFAYEPYDGPRGYYVPHPPTEALRDVMRAVQIRNANAIACGEQGLPYYRLDWWSLRPPSFKRSVPKGMHVSLGALKRQRAAAENPGTPDEWRQAKKRRFEEDRAAALAEDRAVKFDNEVSYCEPRTAVRAVDSEQGTSSGASAASYLESVSETAVSPPLRSILKPTRPVRTVSYDLSLWPSGSQETTDESREASTSSGLFVPGTLLDARPDPHALPSSRPDAPEEPGQPLPYTGLVREGAESLTGQFDPSIADSADGAALSGRLPTHPLALTDAGTAGFAPWPDPFAAAGPSTMVRDTDASAAARDSRNKESSGGRAGSRPGHAPASVAERDLEEEMEVEAMLFSWGGALPLP